MNKRDVKTKSLVSFTSLDYSPISFLVHNVRRTGTDRAVQRIVLPWTTRMAILFVIGITVLRSVIETGQVQIAEQVR